MILIGENLNVMAPKMRRAMKNRSAKPLQKMAVQMREADMDYIDLNIGPAKKDGPELMQWLVRTVQEVVDLPMCLDTTNVEAMEAGLQVHKGTAIINSISCRPERMEALMPLVNKYDARFVGLLIGVEGIPRDADERAMLLTEMQACMAEEGVSEDRVLFDPIILPVTSQQDKVPECTMFMGLLQDLAPGSGSNCGLSNISNGAPEELRQILNETYLVMLMRSGLEAAIANAFEPDVTDMARGRRERIEGLIHAVMDGEPVEETALSPDESAYVKTARVLTGESLYSHSWLKV